MNDRSFEYCDQIVADFETAIQNPDNGRSTVYYSGVDLGTACVVLTVLNEHKRPVAGAYRYADVVRDGMVVDYIGAIKIVRELKEEIETKLGCELVYAAAAKPAGTDMLDAGAVKNVVQEAGFTLTAMLDESSAANHVLKIQNGAVVDIGGGTTGISVLKDGKVAYIADEPTGGTHFSLVIAGAYKMPLEEAEIYKRDVRNHKELFPVIKPVMDKIASIILQHTKEYDVNELSLVGGASCFSGIEETISHKTGIYTHKPRNPMFVTPIGIALSCSI